MSKDKRLDPKVIEEAQNYKDHLDNLDIKSLWEELDKLVPEDQTHKTHTTLPGYSASPPSLNGVDARRIAFSDT